MRHQFFKTARFYAVYGSGGFSVGVLSHLRIVLFGRHLYSRINFKLNRAAALAECIDLGCASNRMRIVIGATAPKVGFQLAKPPLALELAFTGCGVYAPQPKSNHRVF